MKHIINASKVAVVALAIAAAGTGSASAAQNGLKTLDIIPICSDKATSTAYWEVTNSNVDSIDLSWANLDTNVSGDFVSVAGTTQLNTNYDGNQPNNQHEFVTSIETVRRNAKAEDCKPGQVVTTPTTPTPPVTPGMGAGSVDPTVVTQAAAKAAVATPVVAAKAAPQLANTGVSQSLPLMAASMLAAVTGAISLAVRRNLI